MSEKHAYEPHSYCPNPNLDDLECMIEARRLLHLVGQLHEAKQLGRCGHELYVAVRVVADVLEATLDFGDSRHGMGDEMVKARVVAERVSALMCKAALNDLTKGGVS